jgi:soluble lytic murein transglycosylase-like protein
VYICFMVRRLLLLSLVTAALAPASASAAVPHTVQPGETLWSIAAANNLTTRTVAAFNGVSENSNVILGATIHVPTTFEGAAALQRAGIVPGARAATATAAGAPTAASVPAPVGAYTVRPGDTLSALAARSRVGVRQVAWMNGLSPDAQLVAGTSLKLPTGSPIAAPAAPQPVSAAPRPAAPSAPPYATGGRVTAGQVGSIAAQNGVSPSLATAVASMESGFNNSMVSSTSARGVMQIMPGTWDWVQRNLASNRLDPRSPSDNVRAGSLYLGRLIRETGGNVPMAVAGYYQGLGSVRSRGLFDDTRRYVANVLALQRRFGG